MIIDLASNGLHIAAYAAVVATTLFFYAWTTR